MMRQTMMIAALAIAALSGQAFAGVEGGHWEGTLYYADGETANFISADFFDDGTWYETDDEGVEVPYPGEYTENDFLIVSIWNATYTGYSNYQVSGVSLFGVVSLYVVDNTDGDNDYSGIVFRDGDAQDLLE